MNNNQRGHPLGTATPIHNERLLLDQLGQALAALEQATGLKGNVVTIEPKLRDGYRANALIDIQVNGQKLRYVVEAKTRIDRLAPIGHLKAKLDQLGQPGILFAPYITTTIAKLCRQIDMPFLDTAGNAYLRLPDRYIFITGEKPTGLPATEPGTKGGTPTALRVIFTLLCKPVLLNAPYREIVQAADVALGAVGWIFFDLEQRGHVVGKQKRRNRQFIDPVRLFEEWVTNYPIKLRPKLNARRFTAQKPKWRTDDTLNDIDAYWGGEDAAEHLTRYIKPTHHTIYLNPKNGQENLTKLAARCRLRADPEGDIEVLDAFWKFPLDPTHPTVVPPILAYADLVATHDPRNLEAAKLVREKLIDHALRKI